MFVGPAYSAWDRPPSPDILHPNPRRKIRLPAAGHRCQRLDQRRGRVRVRWRQWLEFELDTTMATKRLSFFIGHQRFCWTSTRTAYKKHPECMLYAGRLSPKERYHAKSCVCCVDVRCGSERSEGSGRRRRRKELSSSFSLPYYPSIIVSRYASLQSRLSWRR